MASLLNKTYSINHTTFKRVGTPATADISAGLIVDLAGGICNATAYPYGTAIEDVLTGENFTVVQDYEYGYVTSGAAILANGIIASDANGKAYTPSASGTYFIFGVAIDAATGADETIKYKKLPVYTVIIP